MSRDPLALFESVSKTYTTATGKVEALHAVDAEVPRAGITAVTGVSGSGKSTLLRLLAGHDTPTAELDRGNAGAVIAALQAASSQGATFVVATHDPEVTAIADHLIDLAQRVDHRPAPAPRRSGASDHVVVTATGLTKTYGDLRAVSDVSIELRAGQLAVVVGRSGSGKSTLLMLLGGWSEPDAGTIGGITSYAWSDCAYVPQRFGLVPELTVADNVELPARGAAGSDELLARLALAELRDRYPAEISIGQQQRVAVARALVLRPRLLLVDEPTSHQDRRSAELVWSALSDAAAAGSACLIATHEPDARVRADVSWEIEGGRVARSC